MGFTLLNYLTASLEMTEKMHTVCSYLSTNMEKRLKIQHVSGIFARC